MLLIIVVVVGIACGVFLWVNYKKNNKMEDEIDNTEEEITIKYARIVGSECQKSIISAIIRSVIGTSVGFYASSYLFEGAFIGQIFIMIGGVAGAIIAKNKYSTIFQVEYADGLQETVIVSNESNEFDELCKHLEK